MAALSRRDIEMIFRAETDKATRPIADLGKAVKATRSDLESLVDAAAKGDVSLEKLGDTTRDLKKAQDELGTARSLLTQLNAQEAALEKAQAKVDETGKKYRDLAERVAGAEKPTKTLTNAMAAAERSFNGAQERLGQVTAQAAETRAQIEGIIGPVANVDASFREIANTSKEIARGLALAGEAADDFAKRSAAAAKVAAAADAKTGQDAAFAQQGQSAGLLQAQIDYISQFENRVELLAQAKRELASQNAGFDQALRAQEAKVGAANVEELRRGITETYAAADRLESINAFRQIAADAAASINNVDRFARSEDTAASAGQRLATAVGEILNPSRAAISTIDGIEKSITAVSASIEGKGRKSMQEYNAALNELSAAGAAIGRTAQAVDAFKDQQVAVERAAASFRDAQGDALRLADALANTENPTREMANELKRAEANVTTAGTAMGLETAKLEEMSRALKTAGVDTANLTLAEQRLAASAREAAAAATTVNDRTSGKAGGGLFGLNPQDATNLSYQLNDIFTQLASGQSIFITLAQQGPQIWQIGGIKAYAAELSGLLIPLAAVAAGLGVVAGAAYLVYKATSPSEETQAAQAFLASLGEKADITADQMGRLSKELENYGAKAKDANAIAQEFANAGLEPSYVDAYAQAIANAAQVTGKDMTDASKALTDALGGGYDAAVRLNDQYGVLSDAELENIRVMYDSGKADEARQLIFDRFTAKYQDAADKMNGPWSNAWRNLKAAAGEFANYIGGTVSGALVGLRKYLDSAATGVNYLLLRLRGLSVEQAGMAAVNNQGRVAPKQGNGRISRNQGTNTAGGDKAIKDAERELDVRKRLTGEQRKENAAIDARRKALESGYAPAQAERLAQLAAAKEGRAIADEQAKAGARAAKKGQSDANKAAREAEALANKIKSQSDSLETSLDAMGAKVAKISAGTLQDQLASAADAIDKQYAANLRKLEDFSKLTGGKGKIGGQSISQYRDEIDQNKVLLTQQAQLKVYEDNVNSVLAQRKALLADIEDNANAEQISSAEAIAQTQEVTSKFAPIIESLVNSAKAFATSVGGAKPSAEITAFISKLNSVGQRAGGDATTDNRKEVMTRVGAEETKLNQILAQRNALVESYNTLNKLGLITNKDARERSAAAYEASKVEIDAQSEKLRATLAAGQASIDPQVYDTYIAKLQAIGAQAEYLDPRFAQIKQSLTSMITSESLEAIDKISDAFGRAANGSESWGDALADVGNALLELVGSIIKQTAKIIIQAILLQAIDKLTGGFVKLLLQSQAGGKDGEGGGKGFSLFGLKLFHGGGKVGNALGGQQRSNRVMVSPAALAAAPRYHDGTPSVGLKSDEQVAVLQKGEQVLTEEQQRREAAAKKGAGGGGRDLRQVLAFGDDEVAAAMSGPAGEDVTVTHIKRNVPLIKQMLE